LSIFETITTSFGAVVELAQHHLLHQIAMSAGPYGTDEDADHDPETAVFDLGSDPLIFCEFSAEQVKSLRLSVFKDHESSRVDLAMRYQTGKLLSAALLAAEYVGGTTITHLGLKLDGMRSQVS
jgi:hypothetical protein